MQRGPLEPARHRPHDLRPGGRCDRPARRGPVRADVAEVNVPEALGQLRLRLGVVQPCAGRRLCVQAVVIGQRILRGERVEVGQLRLRRRDRAW